MCDVCGDPRHRFGRAFGTRRDGRVYPKRESRDLKEFIEHLDARIRDGAAKSMDFPKVIVFDWNGTVDARDVGIGIPTDVIMALKRLGKTVIVYTSSVKADRKLFMRKWCEENGIPYTDNAKILDSADMYVADKKSDEKRAGKHGVTFVYTGDFSMEKVLPKMGVGMGTGPVRHFDGEVEHRQLQGCKCQVVHPGKPHQSQYCDCQVVHPES